MQLVVAVSSLGLHINLFQTLFITGMAFVVKKGSSGNSFNERTVEKGSNYYFWMAFKDLAASTWIFLCSFTSMLH